MLETLVLAMLADPPVAKPLGAAQATPWIAAKLKGKAPKMKALLRDGYDIISVDAPVGGENARFILRKDDTVYSCEVGIYQQGNAVAARIIPFSCYNLTPDSD